MKLLFTKKELDALPPPENGQQAYHYDSKVQGLSIGVSPKDRKTFILYRKIQGRPERIKLGRYPDLSIEQARGMASKINAEIAQGENPAQRKRAIRSEMTLRELFLDYLERHAKVHKKSWQEDEAQFRRYLGSLRHRKLSEIRKPNILALHVKVGRENGPYAANRLLALLRAMFNKAQDWGWEGINPARGLRKFREYSRDRFLMADEVGTFLQALKEEPNETIRDYILVSLLTGARKANVMAMRWKDLQLNRSVWRIPETKIGEWQLIPLVPEVSKLLRDREKKATNEWVFPGPGRTGHLVEPKTTWKGILKRARIENFRMHDLRRTLGSWQATTGASLTVIGKTLGHKNPNTTAIYARLDLEPVRKSVHDATRALLQAARIAPETRRLRGRNVS